MQYKTRFRPIEKLTASGWQRFDPPAPQPMPAQREPLPSKERMIG